MQKEVGHKASEKNHVGCLNLLLGAGVGVGVGAGVVIGGPTKTKITQ